MQKLQIMHTHSIKVMVRLTADGVSVERGDGIFLVVGGDGIHGARVVVDAVIVRPGLDRSVIDLMRCVRVDVELVEVLLVSMLWILRCYDRVGALVPCG